MYGKINENLYVDDGGAVEYYILRESEDEYIAHAFRRDEDIEDIWKHWEMHVTVTDEMLTAAAESYGPEDVEFLAAMDELQQCPLDPEAITEEEKQDIIDSLSA